MLSAFARYEWINDIALATNNAQYLMPGSGTLPNDRFLWGLRLQFEGRMTNPATGGPTGVQADAPYSLLEQIKVVGTHRPRNQREEFFVVRGADLWQKNKVYVGTGANQLSTPTTLSTTASATNDVRFVLDVPFVPQNVNPREKMGYVLDAPNYDQLQLILQFADDKSVFTGQTTAPTFTAYGSAGGNPRVRVNGLFSMGGAQRFAGYVPGRMFTYYQEMASGDIVGGATQSQLYRIPRGYKVRSILAKTGVKSSAVSAGNNVYNTLSNTILTNIKVMQGLNKQIRFWADFYGLQQDTSFAYSTLPSTGYGLIDFANQGLIGEALNTSGLIAGPSGDTDLFVAADIAGAANQAALFLIEELRYTPAQLAKRR